MEHVVLDLQTTLFCGQSFGWQQEGDIYSAVLDGKLVRIHQKNILEACSRDLFLQHYFDMDWEYPQAESYLCSLGYPMADAVAHARGLHILNQDPWEVLIGFILSQNNNIKRITQMFQKLGKEYGTQVESGRYSFPTPKQLQRATETELRALGMGFRAPYILDAIQKSSVLETIPSLGFEDALLQLMTIRGVGRKVGSCVLLYGYHRMEAFPLDTWMKKAMARWYPHETSKIFSPYAALAQQYLFHYIRTMEEP